MVTEKQFEITRALFFYKTDHLEDDWGDGEQCVFCEINLRTDSTCLLCTDCLTEFLEAYDGGHCPEPYWTLSADAKSYDDFITKLMLSRFEETKE
jgi:hypothetical protein